MDKQQIKQQAKEILDKFAKALEKAETKKEDFYVDRDEFEREESNGKNCDEDFKKKMLENSPENDEDFVIAERGGWK